MKAEEKERMMNMGALEFWNEQVFYYRNKVRNALTEADFIDSLDLLKVSRSALKWAEKRLLYIVIALVLTVSGCQTFDGVKGDIHWLTADNDHSVQEK